jgi:RNA polymerase sigma factor (sigma-70 family)
MAVVISDRLLESSDRLLDAEPDDHLVSLVQTGHEAAFAAIVRRYERELQAHAHRLSSDGRGEDVVQQAFLNAFSAMQNGSEVRHLRGWLHQILRNEVTRARVPIDAPLEATVACGEALEDTVARRATAHAALAEISALPDRQRDALLGTAVFGFPRAHVARTMGLSEGAVRQLVHRARLRLRQAASALIPFPLVKFFGAARSGVDATPDAALGAGTAVSAAASGGLAVKVGALLTSGLLATGIAVTHSATSHHHHAAAPAAHRAGSHAGARHVSPRLTGPATSGERTSGREAIPAGRDEHAHGGPARASANRSGRHRGSASGRGRVGGQGHDGSTSGRGDEGSGRSSGPTSGRSSGDGSSGSPAGSGSGSRSGSGSGSGDGGGSSSGRSGSGSSGGRQGGSGSGSGSVTGSATSGSDDSAGSSDGAGSARSSGGGDSSGDSDASLSSSSGSSGSPPSGSATATDTSGGGGSTQGGGSDQANVASLGSDGAQGADSGSGSGSGKENSDGSRDVSGATDSSSS